MLHLHTYFMYLGSWSHVKVTWLARSSKWRKFWKPWCGADKPEVQVPGSCTLFLLFAGSQEPRPQPVHPGLTKQSPGGTLDLIPSVPVTLPGVGTSHFSPAICWWWEDPWLSAPTSCCSWAMRLELDLELSLLLRCSGTDLLVRRWSGSQLFSVRYSTSLWRVSRIHRGHFVRPVLAAYHHGMRHSTLISAIKS